MSFGEGRIRNCAYLSAESSVKDELKILKAVVEIEIALEERSRCSPALLRDGPAACDVVGDSATREEPDLDEVGGPFCREHASADLVEARSEGEVGGVADGTSGVLGLVGCVNVAVWGHDVAGIGFGVG